MPLKFHSLKQTLLTMRSIRKAGLLLLLSGLVSISYAKKLGQIGPVYPIVETDLLVYIEQTLKQKEKNGELAQLEKDVQKRARDQIENPTPIAGINTARMNRVAYYDPSITFPENITDNAGHIIVLAGTRKNPLDVVPMTRTLVFFDARDARQVLIAKELVDKLGSQAKPILVGGSYMNLMREWKVPVYYDQVGLLSRMDVHEVPAIVTQEGKRLKINIVGIPL